MDLITAFPHVRQTERGPLQKMDVMSTPVALSQ